MQFTSHPFRFDVETASQAVAHLLRSTPGRRMNYMRLLKLLYIVERECLRDAGRPLTGSRTIAMQRGPVLEDVFGLIKNDHYDSPSWQDYFSVDGYHLAMTDDPGTGQLSPFVRRKLAEVAERHKNDDEWAMVEITHQLPEWKKNDPGISSKTIPVSDILEAVGRLEDAERIIQHAKDAAYDAKVFADCARTAESHLMSN